MTDVFIKTVSQVNGCVLFPPSEEKTIETTQKFLQANHFAPISQEYQYFLRQSNGFILNGVELFGTISQPRIEKNYTFPSIEEINRPCANYNFFNGKMILGRMSESLLIYDEEGKLYAVADRINLRSRIEFNTFGELLVYILSVCGLKK